MLGGFAERDFRMIVPQAIDVAGFLEMNGSWLDANDHYFGVLHADPSNGRTPGLIDALVDVVPNAFFVGGMTSSGSKNLQVSDHVTSGGVSGVLFSGRVPVVTSHTQGCSPLARSHVVTRCQRNIAIELDGRPALDVLREDVGEVIAKDLRRMEGYIFAALPIAGSDTGDYLVRNIVGIDPERGWIAIGDEVEKGRRLVFVRRDPAAAREDMTRMLTRLTSRMKEPPKGALYHACVARGRHMFGEDGAEIAIIREALGDIPLVGFFANGEICHNRLYGYTGVLSLFF
jgi:small ligand-binding sensory domain FIST